MLKSSAFGRSATGAVLCPRDLIERHPFFGRGGLIHDDSRALDVRVLLMSCP